MRKSELPRPPAGPWPRPNWKLLPTRIPQWQLLPEVLANVRMCTLLALARNSSKRSSKTLHEHFAVNLNWRLWLPLQHFAKDGSLNRLGTSQLQLPQRVVCSWRQSCACEAVSSSGDLSPPSALPGTLPNPSVQHPWCGCARQRISQLPSANNSSRRHNSGLDTLRSPLGPVEEQQWQETEQLPSTNLPSSVLHSLGMRPGLQSLSCSLSEPNFGALAPDAETLLATGQNPTNPSTFQEILRGDFGLLCVCCSICGCCLL